MSNEKRGNVVRTAALLLLCATAAGVGTASGPGVGSWVKGQWGEMRTGRLLRAGWDSLATSGAPLGKPGAPLVAIEFSDYECPFCRRADATLDSLLRAGTVRLSFHHLPLVDIHPAALGAAESAICAEEQGRFQEMHHFLMTESEWRSSRDWAAVAKAVGIADLARFEACLKGPATQARLKRDKDVALALGIAATPTFFRRYKSLVGTDGVSEFIAKAPLR